MSDPTFGLSITRVDNEPRPAVGADLSVIGLVVTAPDADATRFPLNTPVLVFSDDATLEEDLGTTGSVAHQLDLINAQLGEFQVAARVVIVRADEGADDAATMTNLIEALDGLETSGAVLGVVPRLIGIPGFTYQQEEDIENPGVLLANPVIAALAGPLERMLAHAVVTGPHSTLQAFTDWRETIQSDRIIPVETWVKVGAAATVVDSVGSILGAGVRRDHEKQGRPFHSWANQPIQGIVGPNRPIGFSLTDGATEGQTILAANGGVILRGEAGVETAIASGGFVFVGTDNAGEDDVWRFYNVTRGRDYIHLLFLRTLRFYLGRFNLTGQTIEAVTNTMKMALRDLQADGDILGFKMGFSRDQNNPEQLRLGKFTIDFAAEEAPVLRYIGVRSARYRPALDALLDNLITQLDQAA
ncbi:phage tail protein [Pararhizobium haloflavum]|uniref:phage tail protein n=1 Tax=Pararhizobium haloflavum TaxID=2037914 RepID=UPI000C19F81B|nr:phage tail protein [Pararhizobium haloflavum]